MGGKENTTYDNKARTTETGDAKHWRRDPKGGGREDKEPYAKPKGRCGGGLGVVREGEDPDPGKTPRIRRCRRTESGKQSGAGENVYYMRRHLLTGGSDLLDGDCFSISPRQSSNTLATFRLFFALVSIQAA